MADMKMDPVTGEWEDVNDKSEQSKPQGGPRRSWKRGGEAGAYDFKFQITEDDGRVVTVLCKYTRNLKEIEQTQDEILSSARDIQTLATNFQHSLAKAGAETVSPQHLKETQSVLLAANARLAELQSVLARRLVSECVIGWRGAPVMYSDAARNDLPDEICTEWMPEIINRSQLSKGEGDFLASDSSSSSAVTP